MIRYFLPVFMLIFIALANAQVKKGDKGIVISKDWISVKNAEPIKNGDTLFRLDVHCETQQGALITVLATEGSHVFAKYSISGKQYGKACPSGTLFFTTEEKFLRAGAEYRRIRLAKKAKKEPIKSLR